ncbi:uncharacterized protein EAF02_006978 [Botrytis sinoallii]|uniref:uncharacterized protein n=1 Tax=Botrytis sinoallii TaxID=1463999 RepID=UPI0019008737|nr:uncharacterized protein EAF02_006978 [Botrytis sinoallii]KAF7881087.1 hypothetical protein EAF02_006978 [Botrytis sinoallii]
MGNIYNGSTLTLIAAVGDNPHAGLRGVSHRPESPIEPYEIINHGKLLTLSLCLPSLCEEVRKGKWYTRVWTYQEQCLSQRCLYFTSNELFFNPPKASGGRDMTIWSNCPSQDIQVRTGPPWWSKRHRKDPDPTPYRYLGEVKGQLQAESYIMTVQEYSQRNLTHSNDVLDAFEGIFHRFNRPKNLSNLSIHQTQGIPADVLSQALLWFPSKTCQKRVRTTQARMAVKHFSTWSCSIPLLIDVTVGLRGLDLSNLYLQRAFGYHEASLKPRAKVFRSMCVFLNGRLATRQRKSGRVLRGRARASTIAEI